MLTELIAAAQKRENGNGNGNGHADEPPDEDDEPDDELQLDAESDERRGRPEPLPVDEDPGAIRRYRFRHPTASGKTIAASGFVEAARTEGVLILTHRRLLVDQFRRELTEHGYGDRFTDAILDRPHRTAAVEPDHDPDLRVVRAPRRRDRARRVPARDLRRGAHRARREDVGGDPLARASRSTSA